MLCCNGDHSVLIGGTVAEIGASGGSEITDGKRTKNKKYYGITLRNHRSFAMEEYIKRGHIRLVVDRKEVTNRWVRIQVQSKV